MRTHQATAEVFLQPSRHSGLKKTAFLEKVISDPELKEDLIDVMLIEEAKKVKGKQISAKEYFAKRHKEGRAA